MRNVLLVSLVGIACVAGGCARGGEMVGYACDLSRERAPIVHGVERPGLGTEPVWLGGALGEEGAHALVLLDGGEYFGIAQDIESLYSFDEKAPPVVIVALPTTSVKRWRDYTPTTAVPETDGVDDPGMRALYEATGGFDAFADFVQDRVLPLAEREHGAPFASVTIFGHSMGGLGAMAFMLERPGLFDRYIIVSPAALYDDFHVLRTLEATDLLTYERVFLSAGRSDAPGYLSNTEFVHKQLEERGPEGAPLRFVVHETEGHGSSGLRGLLDGIEFVYADERPE